MGLDNDTRGWIMAVVSGIGMIEICQTLKNQSTANFNIACTVGGMY
jgi:hypothetical protein